MGNSIPNQIKGFKLKENFELDYVQAAIETIELMSLFLVHLTSKQKISEFSTVLQALITRSDPEFQNIGTDIYCKGVRDISVFAKDNWKELNAFDSFFKVLRETRDYLSMFIDNDAISSPYITLKTWFLAGSFGEPPSPLELLLHELGIEEDQLSPSLREALKILRDEDKD